MPRMVNGRQILWMIYDYHKYDEEYGAVLNFTDLLAVRLKSDAGFEGFMTSWESVLAGMAEPPAESILEPFFLEQLRASTVLKEELAHYERAKRGSETRT